MPSEQAAEKAGVLLGRWRRWRELAFSLLQTLLKLLHLRLGLIEGDVLHQHGLREDVLRVRSCGEILLQELLGLFVFFGELGLPDLGDQVVQHCAFLWGHCLLLVLLKPEFEVRMRWRAESPNA